MPTLLLDQPVPVYSLTPQGTPGSGLFQLLRPEGQQPSFRSNMLLPHRKDYYHLVFVQRGGSRHWVDMTPYVLKENTFYFSGPGQLQVKEKLAPLWGVSLAFTREFLALQQNAALAQLPLLQNPRNGHELLLTPADVAFVEDTLARLEAEYHRPGQWQQPMLTAYLTVLLTYLSRLYTEQFPSTEPSADQLLVQKFRARIEEGFRERHEVGAYAALLHISAGHLSELVKAQSGKPAIAHIQERLVLEARRLLFHSEQSVKEIAFDLGFADASYFSRFFKRETGLTPAEYRSSSREMYP
ncbi:helix-turn-helix domain-containing protein [Hymenobacter cellulosilyticus]|uniref:AraC family transcriptional regulator n=1 Tax=Hymenobacter cellulosilyticus TaxID=2932248 RepID=A0A8T9Q7E1_9BACT|nr:helix-turn-helix domain-containing protein [Hymenobacter cellulosilyticus]UOQ73055.1 AraC family transcriptional regulator [Hymenobacter cellulosilyticus]